MVQLKTIKIQNLMLDVDNYRIGHQEGQPQSIRAIIEEQEDRLRVLAEDIIANGLSPIELFMVMPVKDLKNRYSVIEGNRRTTAIKLILNPDLAAGTILEKQFKKLHDAHANEVPQEIDCVVVPSKKDGLTWIQRRHDRALKGAGIEDWSSTARDRADAELGKFVPAKDVREFVLSNAKLAPELQKKIGSSKFNNTNLTRILGTSYIRGVLGFKTDKKTLTSTASPAWLLQILTDIVVAIASEEFDGKKFSESTIDKVEQREEFIDKLVKKHPKPSKVVNSWIIRADQKISPTNDTSTPSKPGVTKPTPSSADRKHLIPRDCTLKIPAGKSNNIYHELKKLPIEGNTIYPNAVAVLFRVFIEFGVENYIKNNAISLPKVTKNGKTHLKDTLSDKLSAVMDFMTTNNVMNKKELKPIRDAMSKTSSPISTESLNAYVHNASFNPKPLELKTSWDDMQAFISKLWQP